jgi:hypothetical protein
MHNILAKYPIDNVTIYAVEYDFVITQNIIFISSRPERKARYRK